MTLPFYISNPKLQHFCKNVYNHFKLGMTSFSIYQPGRVRLSATCQYYDYAIIATCVSCVGDVMTITMLLASLNSCVNPWVYVFFISNMRLSGVTCQCCCSQRAARDHRTIQSVVDN